MLKGKSILKDSVFQLLMLNMLAVLISYSYNSVNMSISSAATNLRQGVIAASILHLLLQKQPGSRLFHGVLILPFAILILGLLNFTLFDHIGKTLTFIIPYLYLFLVINHLLSRYSFESVVEHSVIGINLIYLYPVLTYYIFDTGFESANIYGFREGSYFVSNHYGWSATLFICSLPVSLKFFNKNALMRVGLIFCLVLAAYLVVISVNRSSLISLSLALTAFLLMSFKSPVGGRRILRLLPLLFLIPLYLNYMLKDKENSAIDLLKTRNEQQFERGEIKESRLIVTNYTFRIFNENPLMWLTGVGIFNHRLIRGASNLGAYHNSYWEILFGCGLPLFLLFMLIMVFRPLKFFLGKQGSDLIIIIPLIIIPFFESNITGGQFLFFPWFTIMLLLNVKRIKTGSQIQYSSLSPTPKPRMRIV